MSAPLKVLYACAEAAPFTKVGGLGDVAGALPVALAHSGVDIRVVTPLHGATTNFTPGQPFAATTLRMEGRDIPALYHRAPAPTKGDVVLVEVPGYFPRPTVYGQSDDLDRFLLFSRAVMALPARLNWRPDILHLNDWHSAYASASLKSEKHRPPWWDKTAVIYTIHNVQHQGHFAPDWLRSEEPENHTAYLEALTRQGIYPNMAALAVLSADYINTVSHTYANEILTPEYGYGLDPLLRQRQDRLTGILNGIDTREFNPATDSRLASRFTAKSLDKRSNNKAALQQRAGITGDPTIPVLGIVTRLVDQKGMDILLEALHTILPTERCQFVLLGNGMSHYEEQFRALAQRFPGQASATISFDEPLARLIYGGADVFLMPSRFEPCGLGQMIAYRYGAIPLVRRTGGLADTVYDVSPDLARGTGFVFLECHAQALAHAMRRAIAAYQQGASWRRLMARVMALDFSWNASARQYLALYQKARELVGGA
ncbi:MAG: glycogen synthase [Chloroflexi bacterium]|nr:glycogen synthase [Chloroflexota bacterium]